ncbi:hypothetical protein UFOVP12_2 [uncultured Caudovirales phage]|uniref:Uncharacterized protein n=1 Tax=uncultured Caudovirales phage TaxID=2100421 RepID=A0A6J5KIJ2_9CAUD|nr:hypothetical protein UFOVP12_2 [uncultured Caudovirales phage]
MKIIFTRVEERLEITQAECDNFIEVDMFSNWFVSRNTPPTQSTLVTPLSEEEPK